MILLKKERRIKNVAHQQQHEELGRYRIEITPVTSAKKLKEYLEFFHGDVITIIITIIVLEIPLPK